MPVRPKSMVKRDVGAARQLRIASSESCEAAQYAPSLFRRAAMERQKAMVVTRNKLVTVTHRGR